METFQIPLINRQKYSQELLTNFMGSLETNYFGELLKKIVRKSPKTLDLFSKEAKSTKEYSKNFIFLFQLLQKFPMIPPEIIIVFDFQDQSGQTLNGCAWCNYS